MHKQLAQTPTSLTATFNNRLRNLNQYRLCHSGVQYKIHNDCQKTNIRCFVQKQGLDGCIIYRQSIVPASAKFCVYTGFIQCNQQQVNIEGDAVTFSMHTSESHIGNERKKNAPLSIQIPRSATSIKPELHWLAAWTAHFILLTTMSRLEKICCCCPCVQVNTANRVPNSFTVERIFKRSLFSDLELCVWT